MKLLLILLAINITCLISNEKRTNIVLILSDDQAWTDYGFMGHETIQTPHLDQLASRSLVFKRGYVASPICRPSLASMITGLFPFSNGVTGNDVIRRSQLNEDDPRGSRREKDLLLRDNFYQNPNFIKELKKEGYLTHQSGKWWEGSYQEGGFTHGMTLGDAVKNGRHGDLGLAIGRKGMEPIQTFIDHTIKEEKPFFLWYAPFLPHTPHNPPKKFLDKYKKPGRAADVVKYYAMCEWFDETCGDLFEILDDRNLLKETVIIYICDNGWAPKSTTLTHPASSVGKGFAMRSKATPYENGIRTPIMISWPDKITPMYSTDFAHAIDLYPTIAGIAGFGIPSKLEGIDLLNEEARQERKTVFGVCHASHNISLDNPDETLQYLWAIEGDYKLMLRYRGLDQTSWRYLHNWDTKSHRLYNLKSDPHEKLEISSHHPEIVKRLTQRIVNWHSVETVRQ